jgi:hypothetical protein
MEIKANEISALIKEQIKKYKHKLELLDTGSVISVGDGVAMVHGLKNAMLSELVTFSNGVFGMVLSLDEDSVGVVIFGDDSDIKEDDIVTRTNRIVEIPVGDGEAETAIGDGLSVGLLRIKDAKPKSKIVILLSDGACTVGAEQGGVDPQAATEAAAKMGVKVYTIGVGSKAQLVPFLLTDGYGRNFIRRGPSGFDEALLKNIAAKTSGMYFAVNDRDGLEMALEEIDKLETTPLEVDEWKRWIEYFPILLSFGVSLVVLASLLSMLAIRRLI